MFSKNVDSIVAAFTKTVSDLYKRAEDQENKVATICDKERKLAEEKACCEAEGKRARTIAAKIEALLSE